MVSFHFFLLAVAAALATTNALLQCPGLPAPSGRLQPLQVQAVRMSLSKVTAAPRRGGLLQAIQESRRERQAIRESRRETRDSINRILFDVCETLDSINRILFDVPRTPGVFTMLPPARLQTTLTTLLGWQCERHFWLTLLRVACSPSREEKRP